MTDVGARKAAGEFIEERPMPEGPEKEHPRRGFLTDTGDSAVRREAELSWRAVELTGALYDALLKRYKDPDSPETARSLNVLCVRLVFCLYAGDAGLFGRKGMFRDYLRDVPPDGMRRALTDLFAVLDRRPEERDTVPAEGSSALAAFPYVGGGLFADGSVIVPPFTEELKALLLSGSGEDFNWSDVSPTVLGAVYESTLDPGTRRSGGRHYTGIENIHKVIDPLFLDALRSELDEIRQMSLKGNKVARLRDLRERISVLRFLDPACGAGNFLTETYLSLRRLENEILGLLIREGASMDTGDDGIKVSVGQFYGIELDGFAVTVAKTALWIAERRMARETVDLVHTAPAFPPLNITANIAEGNALEMDWESVAPKNELGYIMGNPPFVGAMRMTPAQREEMARVFPECPRIGEIDYAAGWFAKAAKTVQGTTIRCAFVSTNSICQGQSVPSVWKPLFGMGVHIDFACRSFRWDSAARAGAHVHCVIVGFSTAPNSGAKVIYSSGGPQIVHHINGYLLDAGNVFVEQRSVPLCHVPPMRFGSMPRDGGCLVLSEAEMARLVEEEPLAKKWVRMYLGADEFINRKKRYCLWLVDAAPEELRACKNVLRRVESVREFRAASRAAATRKFAKTPTLFCQIAQPDTDYILVPGVSSERRRYIPMGFMSRDVIASNLTLIIPGATLYHFGVLTSGVHMAWMRAVCGRLKSDYRYSKDIVYNNFPWPAPTEARKARIEQTARAILDARALYPDTSLAVLYDELTMPPELRRAHRDNDLAVLDAYGLVEGSPARESESACAAELMRMYALLLKG